MPSFHHWGNPFGVHTIGTCMEDDGRLTEPHLLDDCPFRNIDFENLINLANLNIANLMDNPAIDGDLSDGKPDRLLDLMWRKNWRDGEVHTEWSACCGCAFHSEPTPHVHQCAAHALEKTK